MPISRLDDYLVHQIPEPIGTVSAADPNFYDRHYFNLHGSSDEVFLVTGLGQYPNLGVTDAFVSVSVERHPAARCGPRATSPRTASTRRSGPLRVEVIEGLRSLRVVCEPNEWGVAYDLVYDGSVRALEEPKTITEADGVRTQETCPLRPGRHLDRHARGAGPHLRRHPRPVAGARDHSWGVRPVGRPAPVDPAAPRPANAPHGVLPQLVAHAVRRPHGEDHHRRDPRRHAGCNRRPCGSGTSRADRPDDHLGRPEIEIDYIPGTREGRERRGVVQRRGASDLRVRVTPLRTVYLKAGSGYLYDGRWGHGVDQGGLVVEGLTHDISTPEGARQASWLNETLSRYETSDGRVGYGMFENLCAGLYLPAGFDGPDAVA